MLGASCPVLLRGSSQQISAQWRYEHANTYYNREKELSLITNLLGKYTHYSASGGWGGGGPLLAGVLSSACSLPARRASSSRQYAWGALGDHQWPEVPFLHLYHLSLIWIWGHCCYGYLHCFVRR